MQTADQDASESNGKTALGHYQMIIEPETATYSIVPASHATSGLGDLLLMSTAEIRSLATAVTSPDITITNGSTSAYEYDQNRFTILNLGIRDTNTDPTHYHYTGFEMRARYFSPSSTVMTDLEGDDPLTYSLVSFQSIPYNATVERGLRIVNTSGASRIAFEITFDATLTTTAPTEYIKTSAAYLWPVPGVFGTFPIIGAGFGASPTLKVGGTTVTYTSSTATQINRSYTSLPKVSGVMTVDNGTNTLQGPYILTSTRIIGPLGALPSGDGTLTQTLWAIVWNGSGTPDANHCPPTSNLGSWDQESAQATLTDIAGIGTFNAMDYVGVSGTGFKIELIFDRNGNGVRDAGDYYLYSDNFPTGYTITANTSNSLFNSSFTASNLITATCP